MAKFFKKSSENRFNKLMMYNLIIAAVTIVIGLILLFLPNVSNKIVGMIVGVVILLTGANAIYKYLKRDGAKLYSLNLVFAVLYAILGAIIIIYPYTVLEFVTVCLGLYIIINGGTKINYALWFKKGNEDCWLLTLVTGILLIVFGLLVLFNPFVSLRLTQISGAFIIISGVFDLTNTILFKQRSKEIMEIFW